MHGTTKGVFASLLCSQNSRPKQRADIIRLFLKAPQLEDDIPKAVAMLFDPLRHSYGHPLNAFLRCDQGPLDDGILRDLLTVPGLQLTPEAATEALCVAARCDEAALVR